MPEDLKGSYLIVYTLFTVSYLMLKLNTSLYHIWSSQITNSVFNAKKVFSFANFPFSIEMCSQVENTMIVVPCLCFSSAVSKPKTQEGYLDSFIASKAPLFDYLPFCLCLWLSPIQSIIYLSKIYPILTQKKYQIINRFSIPVITLYMCISFSVKCSLVPTKWSSPFLVFLYCHQQNNLLPSNDDVARIIVEQL